MTVRTEAFFLPTPGGDRFCVSFRPLAGTPTTGVLMLSPFAEELNKARAQMARIARAMAASGALVLIGDLHGTGDSAGDFGEASWGAWLDDVAAFAAWLRAAGVDHLCLWGLRLGALLACEALQRGLVAESVLFNAPVTGGKLALTHFLRLGAAGELGSSEAARIDTRALRGALAAGEAVEIAGYGLAPALAEGLEKADLKLPQGYGGAIGWIDISNAEPAPAVTQVLKRWQEQGLAPELESISGPAFWQTQELEPVAALPELNTRFLQRLQALRQAA